jgi:hypothetical protein
MHLHPADLPWRRRLDHHLVEWNEIHVGTLSSGKLSMGGGPARMGSRRRDKLVGAGPPPVGNFPRPGREKPELISSWGQACCKRPCGKTADISLGKPPRIGYVTPRFVLTPTHTNPGRAKKFIATAKMQPPQAPEGSRRKGRMAASMMLMASMPTARGL